MFRDHPLFGVGYGRFYDRKLPYLSDRSQNFELESLRGLQHHNTLLSLLTETGLVGLSLYVALLTAWTMCALQLISHVGAPEWMRAQGVLMLALLASFICSALFHDLTLVASQHALLFMFAGMSVNLRGQLVVAPRATRGRRSAVVTLPGSVPTPISLRPGLPAIAKDVKPTAAHQNEQRVVNLFGLHLWRVTMSQTVRQLIDWCSQPPAGACRYVVTPNVDHAVMFQHRADLRAAYADASMVLADGAPLVMASRLLGRRLPERVAGSDLVPRIFEAAKRPLRVFLLGAAPGVATEAAARIHRQWPAVEVVGSYSPPPGFEHDHHETRHILSAVAAAQPDLLVVGLGAPKQEVWIHRNRHELKAKVAICAGATIDFLAGHRSRSPVWMRRAGLEWLYRAYREPRRLAGRYARDAWVFPQLMWREWWRLRTTQPDAAWPG
jgi:N-acetylglucosaminyldiphosphoundecaprenol N-acetyl-beta-D-mannosaminyltransferase